LTSIIEGVAAEADDAETEEEADFNDFLDEVADTSQGFTAGSFDAVFEWLESVSLEAGRTD
jgi:5,10-methylenetetrahydrofolate reductase